MGTGGCGGGGGLVRFGQPHGAVTFGLVPVFGVTDMMADVSTVSTPPALPPLLGVDYPDHSIDIRVCLFLS